MCTIFWWLKYLIDRINTVIDSKLEIALEFVIAFNQVITWHTSVKDLNFPNSCFEMHPILKSESLMIKYAYLNGFNQTIYIV